MKLISFSILVILLTAQIVYSVQVYSTWEQCAYYQNDNTGYECFDEENECKNNAANVAGTVASTGEFYSSTCASQMSTVQTCLNSCKGQSASNAKTCINACQNGGVTEDLVIGYIKCWSQCTDNFALYTKKQPRSNANADYSLCLTSPGGMCQATIAACTGNCNSRYNDVHKKVLQCCLKDGRYDHYTDAWSDTEIYILEKCISDYYGVNYVNNQDFTNGMNAFRCYIDCTIVNDNYYKNSIKITDLQNVENGLVNSCSTKLQTSCTPQTCSGPAYGASICIRMNRGIYDLNNQGQELNLGTLAGKCIDTSSTMTGLFNSAFTTCYKSFYSNWEQCAIYQNDNLGYECYDEENECGQNTPTSTGQFYTATCSSQLANAKTCLNACKGLSTTAAKTCINNCKTGINQDVVIGYINCWSQCTDNYLTYTKRQPYSIAYADYSTCLNNAQGLCYQSQLTCKNDVDCNSRYQDANKKILTCCMKDGRYDHYTDQWTNSELLVLEKCVSDYYGTYFLDTVAFKNGMNAFRCYLDCTIANDAYYKNSIKSTDLQLIETGFLNTCSLKLQASCTSQTCTGPAYGASICVRMNRGIYNKNNPGQELNIGTLAGKCIDYVSSTMPGVFNSDFSTCYKSIYTTWDQCAYYQNDNLGYECYDEENECGFSTPTSSGEFYSSNCQSQLTTVKTCLNACKGLNPADAKTCINNCKTGSVTQDIVIGYINCWAQCTDNYASYIKRQPYSIAYSDYSTCLNQVGGMCYSSLSSCKSNTDCNTFYLDAFKKILTCCLKDGRYDHYTDAWSNIELLILEKCVSDYYGSSYANTDAFKNGIKNFRCYLDCTIANDNYYKDSVKNAQLQKLESDLVNCCSTRLQTNCQVQTCQAPAYGSSICIRMNRGIYNSLNPGQESNVATLAGKCIDYATTMTGQFNTAYSNCYKNQECVYNTWDQCAYYQNDNEGYECYDEENECGANAPTSSGVFYSANCASQLATAKTCLNACKGLTPSAAKTCINACKTNNINEEIVIGLINCWSQCTDNYATLTKRQPYSIANSEYGYCQTTVGGMCTANLTSCTNQLECNTYYTIGFKKILTCCLKDGRYNHYTDAWTNIEISILQKCISDHYSTAIYTSKDQFNMAMQNFRCYLDCTVVNDNYYMDNIKKNELQKTEDCFLSACSYKLQSSCTGQICNAPAYASNICIRMNRGLYNKANPGQEQTKANLANTCINSVSTMTNIYNSQFADCYLNSYCTAPSIFSKNSVLISSSFILFGILVFISYILL